MEIKKIVKLTKDNTIGEALEANENAKDIFMGFGMHCFSCPISRMETLEQASQVHNIDLDLLLDKLNTRKNF